MAWRISPLAFAQRYLGAQIDSAGGIGGECVDLANQWLTDAYGMGHVFRNAVDWGNRNVPGFRWVANGPTNLPAMGDLVVWGATPELGIGVNGHIALSLGCDVMHIVSLDQNWSGHVATLELHRYIGVLGWQHKT